MNNLTRRRFLVASGTAGVAAAAVATGLVSWPDLARKAAEAPLPSGTPILVIVTLYGGNDGLGAVIPYSDPAYAKARPDFAYTAAEVHQLGDGLGLNPAMSGMAGLWSNRQLAIVRGVGYPQPDHSHFRSMDIWQTASPSAPVNTGWIGRWLDLSGDDPTRAVNIGSVLPPLAVGARRAPRPRCRWARPLDAAQPTLGAAFTGLGKSDAADTPFQALVAAVVLLRTQGGRHLQPLIVSCRRIGRPSDGVGRRRARRVGRSGICKPSSTWSRGASPPTCRRPCTPSALVDSTPTPTRRERSKPNSVCWTPPCPSFLTTAEDGILAR